MPRVVAVTAFLKRFRVPFYEGLSQVLAARGVELQLVFGQPDRYHCDDSDIVRELPGAIRTRNRYAYAFSRSLAWQPALKHTRGADLVIVQQANRHLLNHLLLLLRRPMRLKVAFWGHGCNFHSLRPDGIRERFKRLCARRADYWLAYTAKSARVLESIGYPRDRITAVQNALDTREMIQDYQSVTAEQTQHLREQLRLTGDEPVAVFCGRFYGLKDMGFTFQVATELRRRVKGLRLVIVGDGRQVQTVRDFCSANDWATYVGPRYGRDKAAYFRLGRCQLMPGAVGLNIVDSFAFLTPIVTTLEAMHGPEIDYLEDGDNGLIASRKGQAYLQAAQRLLEDDSLHRRLVEGCERARGQYTLDNMIANFAGGVCRALRLPSEPAATLQAQVREPMQPVA